MKAIKTPHNERGMALLVALIFLIMITLISVMAMRSSTLELKMASNEQERARALASAQSAIDGVIRPANFPVYQNGYTICFNTAGGDCSESRTTLTDTAAYTAATNKVKIKLLNTGTLTCWSCQTSVSNFQGAVFSINSVYDDSTNGTATTPGGRADVTQGFVMLLPSGGN